MVLQLLFVQINTLELEVVFNVQVVHILALGLFPTLVLNQATRPTIMAILW